MKDTIVTARRKKIELITLLICFVVSNLIHLYAIIAYHALCFLGDFASLVLWATGIVYSFTNLININENK